MTNVQLMWLIIFVGVFDFLVAIFLYFFMRMHISEVYSDMLELAKTVTAVAKATNDAFESESRVSNEQKPPR